MPVSIRKTWVLWVFSDISCVASSLTPSIYLLFFHSNFPISSEYPKIQFSFNTNSGVKAQSHKAALTTKVSHNGVPRLPTLLLEDYKFRGSCDPPCRSNNSLEWITKLWEAFYLLLPAYYKGENSGTPQERQRKELGERCHRTVVQAQSVPLSQQPLEPRGLQVFIQVSLHRHKWLNYWPLVTWAQFPDPFPSSEIRGWSWKFQPSNYMLGFFGDRLHFWRQTPALRHLISKTSGRVQRGSFRIIKTLISKF